MPTKRLSRSKTKPPSARRATTARSPLQILVQSLQHRVPGSPEPLDESSAVLFTRLGSDIVAQIPSGAVNARGLTDPRNNIKIHIRADRCGDAFAESAFWFELYRRMTGKVA